MKEFAKSYGIVYNNHKMALYWNEHWFIAIISTCRWGALVVQWYDLLHSPARDWVRFPGNSENHRCPMPVPSPGKWGWLRQEGASGVKLSAKPPCATLSSAENPIGMKAGGWTTLAGLTSRGGGDNRDRFLVGQQQRNPKISSAVQIQETTFFSGTTVKGAQSFLSAALNISTHRCIDTWKENVEFGVVLWLEQRPALLPVVDRWHKK